MAYNVCLVLGLVAEIDTRYLSYLGTDHISHPSCAYLRVSPSAFTGICAEPSLAGICTKSLLGR